MFRISTERLANFSAKVGIEKWRKGGGEFGDCQFIFAWHALRKRASSIVLSNPFGAWLSVGKMLPTEFLA